MLDKIQTVSVKYSEPRHAEAIPQQAAALSSTLKLNGSMKIM